MARDSTGSDAARVSSPERPRPSLDSVSSRTRVDLGATSLAGKGLAANHDAFLAARFERSTHTLLSNLPPGLIPERHAEMGYVMLVADGMGGAIGGDVASQTAISGLVELFIQTPDWIMRPGPGSVQEVLRRMKERFKRLPDVLARRAQSEPLLSSMGTALTLAASLGEDLVIAHVGASRAYLFRRGHLIHLTSDQTVAQLLADTGAIRPADAERHHARHVLTGAITASGERAEVELHHATLRDGDQLLLCTSGLTDAVADTKIAEVLERRLPAAEACRALADLALEAGGRDDVTAALACYRIQGSDD